MRFWHSLSFAQEIHLSLYAVGVFLSVRTFFWKFPTCLAIIDRSLFCVVNCVVRFRKTRIKTSEERTLSPVPVF